MKIEIVVQSTSLRNIVLLYEVVKLRILFGFKSFYRQTVEATFIGNLLTFIAHS